MTNNITPKKLAMVIARSEYHQTYMIKSKKHEEEWVKEHWRTFYHKAKFVYKYIKDNE